MAHDHTHGTHTAGANASAAGRRALWWAFGINAAFLVIEAIGGWLSGSLALLADAGHMVSDVTALGVALAVSHVARRQATPTHTYGFGRVEVLSGLLNGLALWIISLWIGWEAYKRLQDPGHIDVSLMIPIAVAGLIANVASAWVLYRHRGDDLNLRGAFLHLMADAAGSVGAILAGIGIWHRGWTWVDPAASVLIAVLIVVSSWALVRESVHILLEGVPGGLDPDEVRRALLALDGVVECHDLHIWTVSSRQPMLTAHLEIEQGASRRQVTVDAVKLARERYGIRHTTFQVEDEPCIDLHADD